MPGCLLFSNSPLILDLFSGDVLSLLLRKCENKDYYRYQDCLDQARRLGGGGGGGSVGLFLLPHGLKRSGHSARLSDRGPGRV